MARTLHHYLDRYQQEHTKPLTRLTHVVGIPMIAASLPLVRRSPRLAAGLFVGGWALQLLGHRIEGNKPAFVDDPVYLLVGPIWVAHEVAVISGSALMAVVAPVGTLIAHAVEAAVAASEP
jgi:uncharacterized membrane protein YGL010W